YNNSLIFEIDPAVGELTGVNFDTGINMVYGDLSGICFDPLDIDIPELGDCYATEVVFYEQGLKSNNSPIAVDRTDASKALGAPQRSDAMNFVALGYGGHIILGFDGAVPNGPGADIEVVETTYNFSSVGAYPEYADVY